MIRAGGVRLLPAAVLLTVALAWMVAPTYPMAWAADPQLTDAPPMGHHSWLDPLLLGYGAFHAPLTFLVTLAAAANGWHAFAVGRTRVAVLWWAMAGVVILVIDSILLGSFGWSQTLVVGLLVGGGAMARVADVRFARRES